MGTPVTGIRIPSDLLALIDERAIDGKTRTDIVIALIRSGLGLEPLQNEDKQTDRYTVLNSRITELEAAVSRLLDSRITELEATVKQLLDSHESGLEVVEAKLLNNRITELEVTVKRLLDNRKTDVIQPLHENETIVKQRETPRQTLVKQLAEEVPPPCPKCKSLSTRWDGYGKPRADGTRSRRMKCRNCGKTSMLS